MQQMAVTGADMRGVAVIRPGVVGLGELGDITQRPIDGVGGVVLNLHVLEPALTYGGQGA